MSHLSKKRGFPVTKDEIIKVKETIKPGSVLKIAHRESDKKTYILTKVLVKHKHFCLCSDRHCYTWPQIALYQRNPQRISIE